MKGPAKIIAIDPDTKNLPVVVWSGGKELEIFSLASKASKEEAISTLAQGLRGLELWTSVLVSEYAHTFSSKSVPEESLFRLHEIVGVLAGAIRHDTLLLPRPVEWKGSVPKTVHQPRILRQAAKEGFLWRGDRGLSSHEIDSIGLFLWAWKRIR